MGTLNGKTATVNTGISSLKAKVITDSQSAPESDSTGFGDTLGQTGVGKPRIRLDMQGVLLSGARPAVGASANVTVVNGAYTLSGAGKIVSVSSVLDHEKDWEGRITVAVNALL